MTNSDKLRARFEEMGQNGLVNFNFIAGPKWGELTHEERCGELLKFLDAEKIPVDGPARSGRAPVDVRELVAGL